MSLVKQSTSTCYLHILPNLHICCYAQKYAKSVTLLLIKVIVQLGHHHCCQRSLLTALDHVIAKSKSWSGLSKLRWPYPLKMCPGCPAWSTWIHDLYSYLLKCCRWMELDLLIKNQDKSAPYLLIIFLLLTSVHCFISTCQKSVVHANSRNCSKLFFNQPYSFLLYEIWEIDEFKEAIRIIKNQSLPLQSLRADGYFWVCSKNSTLIFQDWSKGFMLIFQD